MIFRMGKNNRTDFFVNPSGFNSLLSAMLLPYNFIDDEKYTDIILPNINVFLFSVIMVLMLLFIGSLYIG